MIEYPKIETLYDRDKETFKVIPDMLRWKEFDLIRRWYVTEKIDGTNIRVNFSNGVVTYGGRTDKAEMPVKLMEYLRTNLSREALESVFKEPEGDITLFGEGYGEKIQKGGGKYRAGVSFRLFDVLIGNWWLEPESIEEIAQGLGVLTVPCLGITSHLPTGVEDLNFLTFGGRSVVAAEEMGFDARPEGIVARTHPLLITRSGKRVMWKLKFKDFEGGKK